MNVRSVVVVLGFGLMAVALPAQRRVAAGETQHDAELRNMESLLSRTTTVQITRGSLKEAIDAAAASAQVLIQYREAVLNAYTAPVTIHATNVPLGTVLDQLLTGTSLGVVSGGAMRLSIVRTTDPTSQGGITGTVTDAKTKRPLTGATASLDGATKGVLTDDKGTFHFGKVATGEHTILIKLLGYTKSARNVTVTDDAVATVAVELSESANQLDQVVVTGTVIPTERKAIPNAMTVITAKDIEQRNITHIDQLFRGDIPGLFAENNGSETQLGQVTMFSRGATALSSSSAGTGNDVTANTETNPIKTYVDGVELADPRYLSQIDPKSIERIEILTGPQASTIYGSNAINGVMQIFTKRGTTTRPQLALNLLSGWVETNVGNAKTPQHDYSAQLSGIEGRISYNAGTSWTYIGPWTPAAQSSVLSGFGGARLESLTPVGRVNTDVSLRRSTTQNVQHGGIWETGTKSLTNGQNNSVGLGQHQSPANNQLAGQTIGLTLGYAPTSWWSHDFGLGQDLANRERRITAAGYSWIADSTVSLVQINSARTSMHYTTTLQVPLTTLANATVTGGVDGWRSLSNTVVVTPTSLTGTLTGNPYVYRQPEHNTGAFFQGQLAMLDQLFLTYGVRAEWNPNYGADALPNYAPRVGAAYTHDIGPFTAKLRASYGRSTRPPSVTTKNAQSVQDAFGVFAGPLVAEYGNVDYQRSNPALTPEYQQGGEGGLELYLGNRASLIVTRYNQTVDALINLALVDSVRSLLPFPSNAFSRDQAGYGYLYQYQNLNVGSIRNQGWELQGTMNIGPITTRGTYSFTKSRVIGWTPKYEQYFISRGVREWRPGATFDLLPEHTWALGATYGAGGTIVALNVNGTARITVFNNAFFYQHLDLGGIRLQENVANMGWGVGYVAFNPGYVTADLNASRRILGSTEIVFQLQNLTNHYANDFDAGYGTLGRQTKGGLRVRF